MTVGVGAARVTASSSSRPRACCASPSTDPIARDRSTSRRRGASSTRSKQHRPTTPSASSFSRAPVTTSAPVPTGSPPTRQAKSRALEACNVASLCRRTASSPSSSKSNSRLSLPCRAGRPGSGCQIALASDFTVAAEDSRFWLPFVKRGFTPDSGATWLMPRLVGVARAKELLLLGRPVSGADAAAWGMIHRSVPAAELTGVVDSLVDEFARRCHRRRGPDQALRQRRPRREPRRGHGARGDGP